MVYLFGICVEKNSELPEGHEARKFKYRVVFQGNRVVNQNYEAAMFNDLGSSPATMDAARAADCYGSAPGHSVQIADAKQAYIQAEIKGHTYVDMASSGSTPEFWDKLNLRRPVCRMRMAVDGHLDSGTMWAEHCGKHELFRGLTSDKVRIENISQKIKRSYFPRLSHPISFVSITQLLQIHYEDVIWAIGNFPALWTRPLAKGGQGGACLSPQ